MRMTGPSVAAAEPSEQTCTLGDREFNAFRQTILDEAGIALGDNKKEMVGARLGKRLRTLGLNSFRDYYDHLCRSGKGSDEYRQFINCLTTNKTDFFREAHHFDLLTERLLPELKARADRGQGPKRLRIWCAASSTGEEPYTLAMTVREFFGKAPGWDLQIVASDIDTEVLARAERGVYDLDRAQDIPEPLLRKYFLRGVGARAGLVQARQELRDLLQFQRVNLMDDRWPISAAGPFDIIFCRNVIIYFTRDTQTELMRKLAAQLVPNGYLFLGHSENLHWLSDRFAPIGPTAYQLRSTGDAAPPPAAKRNSAAALPAPAAAKRHSAAVLPAVAPKPKPAPAKPKRMDRTLIVGDVFACQEDAVLKTLLGSCVSACLYDQHAGIGGMNHFSLPAGNANDGGSTRYGIHAMELLINEIMKLGGDRRRLQAKVFGGARVLNIQSEALNIGARNAQFVEDFLATENIPVVSRFLGGNSGLRIHFFPQEGRVFVKPLDNKLLSAIAQDEERYSRDIVHPPTTGDVELF